MKKIGNIILFSLFSSIVVSHDKAIQLYVQDMQQNPIRQVEKAVPFLLQVVVENMDGVLQPEQISGFEHFQVTQQGASRSINIINGHRTDRIIFNYILRAEQTGTYRLGPVSLNDSDGTVVKSNPISVVVGDQTVTHDIRKQPFFLETRIDKKIVYVGQELKVFIRFYYVNDFENFRFGETRFEKCTMGEITQTSEDGKETIKGQDYRYKEWCIKVYPEKTGVLMIPSIQAGFKNSYDFSQGLMGLFDVFGMSSEKVVQSSARSVDVLPLPESQQYKHVSAVGIFDRATFEIKKIKGEVGEGVVATLLVTGSGNFEMMKAPALNLPHGLKHYEANSSVKKLESEKQEKIFEYIIQADQPGEFAIPAQTFVYFDPQQKSYKTLQTNKTTLKIVGDAVPHKKNDDTAQKKEADVPIVSQAADKTYVFKPDQIDYVIQTIPSDRLADGILSKIISWLLWLFGLLALCLGLYWLYQVYVGISLYDTYWGYYFVVWLQLRSIEKKQDINELYQLFEQIFQRFGHELQGSGVIMLLKKNNVSDDKIQEWQLFVQQLLAMVFSKQSDNQYEKQQLLQQGTYWIKQVLRSCWHIKKYKNE